ncbi:Nucleolar protein 13 [Paramyrothecium foliicola]|nr:Nucleolar protein 13 [Paramyrothecium foliicola]
MSSSSDSEPQVDASTSAAKRKAEIDEIEVDLALPEPPSKRAKRALKKGKALPTKANSDDGNEDLEEGEKTGKKEKVRSEHSVWIGNLPFAVTAPQLRKWLVDNSGGVITDEAVTRIKIPTTKEPGRDKSAKPANKGFAYVDFTDIGAKVAAIALSENDLGGRKMLIKDATSFEGRPEKPKEPEVGADGERKDGGKGEAKDPNASRKVFVGNMSFKTTEDDLRRNFERCGEIEWVKVATFEDTGKCKGFGWVKFKEPEAAAWAVKGFIKIKEEVETEEDFNDDAEASNDEPRQKQFKTRKWWVNRMLGRELKLELAEDDQSRYKKRFGKGANKEQGDARAPRPRNQRPNREDREHKYNGEGEGKPANKEMKPLKESEDLQVARLTGAVVKHTGTKMTFD